MTTTIDRPIIDLMVESTSSSDLNNVLMSRVNRLTKLDHSKWIDQLTSDGFTEGDVNRLDDLLSKLFSEADMETQLAAILSGLQDPQDATELNPAIQKWVVQTNLVSICHQVCNSGFPDLIDAFASVVRYILTTAGSTVTFEAFRRMPSEQVNDDWRMDPSEVAEGIQLAEEGIEEDMAEWPVY